MIGGEIRDMLSDFNEEFKTLMIMYSLDCFSEHCDKTYILQFCEKLVCNIYMLY